MKIFKSLNIRQSRILFNMLMSVGLKGSGIIISFLLLPTYMSFFGSKSTLGLWFTLLAFISWFITFDLGISNGLRNKLIDPILKNDRLEINKLVSTSYGVTTIIVILVLMIGIPIFKMINWSEFFNSSIENKKLFIVISILLVGLMIQFLLKNSFAVLYALQKPILVNLTSLITNIFLLIGLNLIPSHDDNTNLYNLTFLYLISTIIPLLFIFIYTHKTLLKNNFPNIKNITKKHTNDLLSLGLLFFIIQVLYLVITNTNEVVITKISNSESVVEYKIYNSIFNGLSMFFIVLMTPIWSEITAAYVKKEYKWLRKLNNKLYKLLFLSVIGLILLGIFCQLLINIWLKNEGIKVDVFYIIIFSLYVFFNMWNSIVSSFANGIGKLNYQLYFLILGVILFFSFILYTKHHNQWIYIVIANIIAIAPYCIFQSIWNYKFLKNNDK